MDTSLVPLLLYIFWDDHHWNSSSSPLISRHIIFNKKSILPELLIISRTNSSIILIIIIIIIFPDDLLATFTDQTFASRRRTIITISLLMFHLLSSHFVHPLQPRPVDPDPSLACITHQMIAHQDQKENIKVLLSTLFILLCTSCSTDDPLFKNSQTDWSVEKILTHTHRPYRLRKRESLVKSDPVADG